MKRILTIVIICFLQTLFIKAQVDTVKFNEKKLAILLGVSLNNNYDEYEIVNPIVYHTTNRYQDNLFLNSFQLPVLFPNIACSYKFNKHFNASLGLGAFLHKGNNYLGGAFGAKIAYQCYQLNSQLDYFIFKKGILNPFIGIGISYERKLITDVFKDTYQVYTLLDKSNLILIQFPLGITFGKRNAFLKLSTTPSLSSFSVGNQNFITTRKDGFYNSDNTYYSKFLFANKMFSSGLVFQNIFQLKVGYKFL